MAARPKRTVIRWAYIAAVSLWSTAVLAEIAADPDAGQDGLYELVSSAGMASAVTAIVIALVTGMTASARRLADPRTPIESRGSKQFAADIGAAIVSGVVAFLIGDAAHLRPSSVGLVAVALGWGGAEILDKFLRDWLEFILGRLRPPKGGDDH